MTVAIPFGTTELCPVRALQRWQAAAGITAGPVFRRIFAPPARRTDAPRPAPVIGWAPIDPGTVARILQARAAAAGFDPAALGGHKSYAVLDAHLELGNPFETHPLNGVL